MRNTLIPGLLVTALLEVACAATPQQPASSTSVVLEPRHRELREDRAANEIYGRARALDLAGRCDDASVVYDEFAATVRVSNPEAADRALEYAKLCIPARPDESVAGYMSIAVLSREWPKVLELYAVAPREAPRAWLEYDRAVALSGLGRTDEAVVAFDKARDAFGKDERGRAISMYGRARAYVEGHRCADAGVAYSDYAAFVRPTDPTSATLAIDYARMCR